MRGAASGPAADHFLASYEKGLRVRRFNPYPNPSANPGPRLKLNPSLTCEPNPDPTTSSPARKRASGSGVIPKLSLSVKFWGLVSIKP